MNKGRPAWWEGHPEHSRDESIRLSEKERSKLNAAVDRVEAGYSAFDTQVKVPRRKYRHIHEEAAAFIFSREMYPMIHPNKIGHSPT